MNITTNAVRRPFPRPKHIGGLARGRRCHLPLLVLVGMILIPLQPGLWAAEKKPSAPAPAARGAATAAPEYRIGCGDVLEISAWKDPNLTRQVLVLPDGRIDFPLIGHFVAVGMTTRNLKLQMEKALRRYIPEPNLSVIVQQTNSMRIYVIGKVNRPGQFQLDGDLNVMQALAMAGGLNPFAKASKIQVYREKSSRTVVYHFDYEKVSSGRQVNQNIGLRRGDVIVVP